MTARKLCLVAALFLLLAPRAVAATAGCFCERAKPAGHGCCDPPAKKAQAPAKDCCEVVPEHRAGGEMIETARPVPPIGTSTAFAPAAVTTEALSVVRLELDSHSGDPPGDPPDLQLSHCTFRI